MLPFWILVTLLVAVASRNLQQPNTDDNVVTRKRHNLQSTLNDQMPYNKWSSHSSMKQTEQRQDTYKRHLIESPQNDETEDFSRKKTLFKNQLNLVVIPNFPSNNFNDNRVNTAHPFDTSNRASKHFATQNDNEQILNVSVETVEKHTPLIGKIIKPSTKPSKILLEKTFKTAKLSENYDELRSTYLPSYQSSKNPNKNNHFIVDGTYAYADETDKWLVDFESKDDDISKGEFQAIHEEPYEFDDLKTLSRNSQNYEDDSKCPPPPTNLLPIVGDGVECTSDIQCRDEDSKCCYNGDKYTCMPTVKPPPYLDWLKQPRSRQIAGNSWLLPVSSHNDEQVCTVVDITYPDEDPLLCPHGFTCLVAEDNDDNAENVDDINKINESNKNKINKRHSLDDNGFLESYQHINLLNKIEKSNVADLENIETLVSLRSNQRVKTGICVPEF